MEKLKKYVEGRITHATEREEFYKKEHGDKPGQTHGYISGQDYGYWKGSLSAYENALDCLEEMDTATLQTFLSARILHATKRVTDIQHRHGNNPLNTHTYFGGETLGYWKGKINGYENVYDQLDIPDVDVAN